MLIKMGKGYLAIGNTHCLGLSDRWTVKLGVKAAWGVRVFTAGHEEVESLMALRYSLLRNIYRNPDQFIIRPILVEVLMISRELSTYLISHA